MDLTTLRPRGALFVILACATLSVACDGSFAETSRRPSVPATDGGADAPVASAPWLPDDRAPFFGISRERSAADAYGTYGALTMTDGSVVVDLDDALIEPGVRERVGDERLAGEAALTARLIANVVIDSPLVFDDSALAQEAFWMRAAVFGFDHQALRDHFASAEPGPFALVDDNRASWRQAAGYGPVPYEPGLPRVHVLDFDLLAITSPEPGQPTWIEYEFSVHYARPVVTDAGERSVEDVELRYAVTWAPLPHGAGYVEGRVPLLIGASWSQSVNLGNFVRDTADLPRYDAPRTPCVTCVVDAAGLALPLPEGWSATSDLVRADQRGITVASADSPGVTIGYYEGVGTSPDRAPYLFTRVDDPAPDPHLSPVEQALADAGLTEPELFWPAAVEGGRLAIPGGRDAWIGLLRASPGEDYDVVSLEVTDAQGVTHFAAYYTDPGEGEELLEWVAARVGFAGVDLAELAGAS